MIVRGFTWPHIQRVFCNESSLCGSSPRRKSCNLIGMPVAIVAAHPDDEILGLGVLLPLLHLRHEPLPLAPPYDFARPPDAGPLYYDRFNWGMHSTEWREHAGGAFREMGIPCMC